MNEAEKPEDVIVSHSLNKNIPVSVTNSNYRYSTIKYTNKEGITLDYLIIKKKGGLHQTLIYTIFPDGLPPIEVVCHLASSEERWIPFPPTGASGRVTSISEGWQKGVVPDKNFANYTTELVKKKNKPEALRFYFENYSGILVAMVLDIEYWDGRGRGIPNVTRGIISIGMQSGIKELVGYETIGRHEVLNYQAFEQHGSFYPLNRRRFGHIIENNEIREVDLSELTE